MIIDGRNIANHMRVALKARAARLPKPPSFLALAVAPDAATESYLRMKRRLANATGIRMEVRTFETASTESFIETLARATEDAVIVQLPLPEHIAVEEVLEAIPMHKDADVLSPRTRDKGELVHPIAGAIQTVLEVGGIEPAGKKVTVVGQGWLVGQPAAAWLRAVGAEVTTVTKDEGDLQGSCKDADIIISGAGVAGLILPEYVRPGAAVIDIGTSELGGSLSGDVVPEVAAIAGLYTPVPGGVGPITVARLLENVILLAEARYASA